VISTATAAPLGYGREALLQAGFDAHNMTGGMLEWQAAGLQLEPADGTWRCPEQVARAPLAGRPGIS